MLEFFSFISVFCTIFRSKSDVVFSFNPKTNLYALLSCSILRKRCVPNVSGVGDADRLSGLVGWFYQIISKFVYSRAELVFFQNSEDLDRFVRLGIVKRNRCEVLPGSGVDLTRFYPKASESGDKAVCFLLACRLIKKKGVEEYLEAANLLAKDGLSARFLLAGVPDFSDRSIPIEHIQSYLIPGKVEFLGHVGDMASLLGEVDAVVLPSTYAEGVPRSLLEGLASGKIIVTTNRPGCRETVIDNENGFVLESTDVVDLYEVFKAVTELDSAKRTSMGLVSRKLAEEKFDERLVISRYLSVAGSPCDLN